MVVYVVVFVLGLFLGFVMFGDLLINEFEVVV